MFVLEALQDSGRAEELGPLFNNVCASASQVSNTVDGLQCHHRLSWDDILLPLTVSTRGEAVKA